MMTERPVPQQGAISKPQGLEKRGIRDRDVFRYRRVIVRRQFHFVVISAHEAFVSFANDPSFASPVEKMEKRGNR